jgi:hypothetical protein
MDTTPTEKLFSSQEASDILGIKKSTVNKMIQEHLLTPIKIKHRNFLSQHEIDRYLAERRHRGAQPHNKNCQHGKNLLPTRKRIPLETRFWKNVKKGHQDECWEWKGPKNLDGYGDILIERKHIGAHRVSYEIHCGPIPNGLWVLHKCDNPPCCNPNHLFLGTARDNIHDMMSKGRSSNKNKALGSQNGKSKLAESDITDIRQQFSNGTPYRHIAKSYNVSVSCICDIIYRKTWKHVP